MQTAVLAFLATTPNDGSCLMIAVVWRIFWNHVSTHSKGRRFGVEAKSSDNARRTVAKALKERERGDGRDWLLTGLLPVESSDFIGEWNRLIFVVLQFMFVLLERGNRWSFDWNRCSLLERSYRRLQWSDSTKSTWLCRAVRARMDETYVRLGQCNREYDRLAMVRCTTRWEYPRCPSRWMRLVRKSLLSVAYHEYFLKDMRIDSGEIDDRVGQSDHQRCVHDGFESLLQDMTDVSDVFG